MKKYLKKAVCIFLCLLVASSSWLCVAAGASSYPDGVTQEDALNAVYGTDKLINNLVPMLTGQTLTSFVKGSLYTDETLSNLLISTYSSLEENSKEIQLIGIDCSTKKLSAALGKYPKVCVELFKFDKWSQVDLTGISWGVDNKEEFADALGAIFSPFNDILYTLLCAGNYKMNNLITIKGDNGYQNAVVPFLNSLKCTGLISQTMFTMEAQENKNSMIKNIVLPVLTMLEKSLPEPMNSFTDILPGFAYFVDSGEFNKCFSSLLSPITSNPLVEVAVFLKILDLDSLTNIDVNQLLSSFATGEGGSLKLAEIDFSALASCTTKTSQGLVADKGKAYVEIMRWLVETLKLNKDNPGGLLSGGNSSASVDTSFFSQILEKDTDAIVATIVLLFNPGEVDDAQAMIYPAFKKGSVENTTTLTDYQLEKVYNEIDDLLDQFVKDGGRYSNIGEVISSSIYTNANINAAVQGIYKALEDEGLTQMLSILGINATPKGVASLLTEPSYEKASSVLSKADSWADVSLKNVTWGFSNGSRYGFQNALTAVLRPLFPLLRVVLVEEDMVILDSVTIKGADGYNTSIIPVLEALGCKSTSIKTYSSFKNQSGGDGVLKNVLNPVFDLLDDVCDKPVQTLIDKVPNIIYFMESGSLEKCISNLLLPVTSVVNRVPGVIDLSLDISSLTKNLDINTLMESLVSDIDINIAEFDIKTLASLGEATEKTSKSVVGGKKVNYTYIESDEKAIVLSLLKIVAKTLKMPGNETLLMGSMGSDSSMSFDTSSMASQFESMSEDEFIAWLYNLFFKERVTIEIVTGEDYSPTIIYKPAEKNNTVLYLFVAYLGLCAVIGLILIVNKKRLYGKAEE